MKKRWLFPNKNIEELKKDKRLTGVSDITLKVLVNRGYDTPEKIESFLFGTLENLHDTRLMQDAQKAIDILKHSIKNGEQMVVYGDYDSDGVNSTVVMTDLLRKAGGNVGFYTNNRFTQGYGMMPSGVDELLKLYPDTKLIITVDNGIMAFEGVDYAKNLGLKVIVTDHHEQGDTIPNADAVVDPKRKDDEYPFKGLCGAGVAFKLMLLLFWEMELPLETVYDTLDIVAVATVGDIVPLVDENRVMVQKGLELVRKEKRTLYKIFREVTGVKEVNAHYTFGFIYVPMLNAIGRLDGDPRRAIEMFFGEDEELMRETITYLKGINDERKKMTEQQCERAEEMLREKGIKNVLVVYDESFHEGIVGLIAGRLKEKYNRPTFVFTKTESGLLKGSARSIDGFHLKKSFEELEAYIVGGGGHAKAAGLSIEEHMVEPFEQAMNELADKWLTEEDYIKKFHIDATIDANNVTIDIVDELKELEPYGESFPKPILVMDNFQAKKPFYMGEQKNHVKLIGDFISLIMWRQAERYRAKGEPLSVRAIGYPELNVYNNRVSLQFTVDGDNYIDATKY
ncbi:single-stranded-DNA-specific exonuclease RecJ (plasmid) [Aneurinibacillus sp. Ricciae_BoGa-3]|uniref:single-stranded-DNA-specific exonuclease RecJ n=1 Tax=Aneurinibacillus sp. Ricciae_BoGa-3 TaxID=3022697 RepID=UPI002340DCE6|nr:single-stranded-DNA-specific exonuclease RecJ [Aneurinibacillus sp. Ricciae_BoGa-3]WCK57720.1 single-stranded-DNA-specific exonuclease RecJ [Aneurinibacillus sp. Ricciae_BoGa-3]